MNAMDEWEKYYNHNGSVPKPTSMRGDTARILHGPRTEWSTRGRRKTVARTHM